jgi:hypothetical protein
MNSGVQGMGADAFAGVIATDAARYENISISSTKAN